MMALVLALQLWQPVDWRALLPLYEARATDEAGVRDVALFLMREQQWAAAEAWLRKLGAAELLADGLAAMGRKGRRWRSMRRQGRRGRWRGGRS